MKITLLILLFLVTAGVTVKETRTDPQRIVNIVELKADEKDILNRDAEQKVSRAKQDYELSTFGK